VAVKILLEPCINCGLCRRACPTETIRFFTTGHRTHVVEPAGCIDCDICIPICPESCIVRDEVYVHDPSELEVAKVHAREWAKRQNGVRQAMKQRAAAAVASAR
jgi:formate hydrogenlyase subunit 6/NADH:ubiquinone oxidoreductase subunit I